MDMYGFYTGQVFDAYEWLGCHLDKNRATFRVFAPAAARVSVIGEFNGWSDAWMSKSYDGNFWECTIDNVKEGQMYKYRIYENRGGMTERCDPYGYGMELRPNNASLIRDMHAYEFHDEEWMKKRSDCKAGPLNIYEVHLGSWKKNDADENGWFHYPEIAESLAEYMKKTGYNYLEIMPLAEHPCDESWGYQISGFYSPTSRYGTADELKEFVDIMHRHEIGVILDFVPVHFAVDGYALADFDGTALYEYPHNAVGTSEWGSKNFMHSRGEVRSFLQSNAAYWLKEYHFDGLRMDAISNMIYWQGNQARGVNMNAVSFLQNMNKGLKSQFPGIILAAEDSTSYPGVTKPVWENGLGFDYKWDMGWMNDTLTYFRTAPEYRTRDYHKLTFSMMYYYDEFFLLPLSHDEVVHGKATILQKMNGDYDGKFPQARAFYLYMYAHPGKKLNFMGNEFGQLREWTQKQEQDWCVLEYPIHDAFLHFMKDLNALYLENPAFWEKDYDRDGFVWRDCHEEEKCVYAFERRSKSQRILAVFNFSDKVQEGFCIQTESGKKLIPLLNSEWEKYGGSVKEKKEEAPLADGKAEITLPAFCGMIFEIQE
ncbi:MAG: 1,4-alpha-glucan branching protein GlgB [Eubacteriales bacterium]|nr:1,4-alpha-glucan branching protein GlgB [Eubacteriales bacterium]